MNPITKAKVFLNRVASGSFKRMGNFAKGIHERTGKPTPLILGDMAWCILRYGIGYQEYANYGFENKSGAQRKTYMTMNHSVALNKMLNDDSLVPTVDDKAEFIHRYRNFLGRECHVVDEMNEELFRTFLSKYDTVFLKAAGSFGGLDVRKIRTAEVEDPYALYKELTADPKKRYVIEEAIHQHPEMNRLCAKSVNTLRMVTIVKDGTAKFIYACLRMGKGDKPVDNATSGGIYTKVDRDGVLRYPAYCEKEGVFYETHPETGTVIKGFVVPMFDKAVELVLNAAMVEPRLGYIGWDVAITENGPVLVEGNVLPGYDIIQNSAWCPDGNGFLPEFEKEFGMKIPH